MTRTCVLDPNMKWIKDFSTNFTVTHQNSDGYRLGGQRNKFSKKIILYARNILKIYYTDLVIYLIFSDLIEMNKPK